jgi:hypothetical protein
MASCAVGATEVSGYFRTGGLVGLLLGGNTLVDCYVQDGTVTSRVYEGSDGDLAGKIIKTGTLIGDLHLAEGDVTLKNCWSTAELGGDPDLFDPWTVSEFIGNVDDGPGLLRVVLCPDVEDQYLVSRSAELLTAVAEAPESLEKGLLILMQPGVYSLSEQLTLDKNVVLCGLGVDSAGGIAPEQTMLKVAVDLGEENDSKHAVNALQCEVVLLNLTVDSDHKAAGVQSYGGLLILESVRLLNSSGAGLTVNGALAVAADLYTEGNAWGAVNVDPGSGVETPSALVLESGELSEAVQIWSDGEHVTPTAIVYVEAPPDYQEYVTETGVRLWTNRALDE